MSGDAWTSREVRFDCAPRISDASFDAFFDSLPEHYWDTWRQRVLGTTLSISSCSRVVSVAGWPWWMPAWAARRSVAALALRAGVTGEAAYVVVRATLGTGVTS